MQEQYLKHYQERVSSKGNPDTAFHILSDIQYDYHCDLAFDVGLPKPEQSVAKLHERVRIVRTISGYRDSVYAIKNSEEFEIIYEPSTWPGDDY